MADMEERKWVLAWWSVILECDFKESSERILLLCHVLKLPSFRFISLL
jgi:hypothetical protein